MTEFCFFGSTIPLITVTGSLSHLKKHISLFVNESFRLVLWTVSNYSLKIVWKVIPPWIRHFLNKLNNSLNFSMLLRQSYNIASEVLNIVHESYWLLWYFYCAGLTFWSSTGSVFIHFIKPKIIFWDTFCIPWKKQSQSFFFFF